jgi:hypothetical protein
MEFSQDELKAIDGFAVESDINPWAEKRVAFGR